MRVITEKELKELKNTVVEVDTICVYDTPSYKIAKLLELLDKEEFVSTELILHLLQRNAFRYRASSVGLFYIDYICIIPFSITIIDQDTVPLVDYDIKLYRKLEPLEPLLGIYST